HFCTFKRFPAYLLISLFCAVYIPFNIILLVPIDLASSTSSSQPLLSLPRRATFALWRVVYWLAFALTWFVLPILQGYMESGNYEPYKKLRDGVRGSARQQLLTLTIGACALLYFVFYAGFSMTSLKALAIALSHTYSLILAMWFMGVGVVQVLFLSIGFYILTYFLIPRSLLLQASSDARLAILETNAPNLHDNLLESESNFKNISAQIKSLQSLREGPFVDWIDDLLVQVPDAAATSLTMTRSQITEDYLVSLSYRLHKVRANYFRFHYEWNQLVKISSTLMDICNAKHTGYLTFNSTRSRLPPRVAYLYYNVFQPLLYKLLAALTSLFSIVLVWSEISQGTHASLLGFISLSTFGLLQETLSFIVIAYMCFSAYYSLAKMKIFNVYVLSQKYTDSSSAIFYATQLCRLTIPLSYSYVNMVPHSIGSMSVYEEFLQKSINLTPLGKYFIIWLPRFILIPVLISYFNLYSRMQRKLGFGQEFGEDDELVGSRVEGRDLIEHELIHRLHGPRCQDSE
ncbi:LMBR1-like membrane protein, partial [Lipomyces arxii]|uniref:LMBR1-like membrane protein n=1 Tax=Lipomyces arxii TaxID=56418 RepID=UPI0034CD2CBA